MKKSSTLLIAVLLACFNAFSSPAGTITLITSNLNIVNANGTTTLADGDLTQYDTSFSNNIDALDARKMSNPGENIGMMRGTGVFAIERRHTIQNADTISTPSRASYRKLFDGRLKIERLADVNVVKDIRLRVNESKKRIDHANMWLMGISRKACKTLDPLPILVLIPMIVHAADQTQEERLDCNIVSTRQNVSVQIRPHGQRDVITQTDNIHTHAVAWNKAVVKSWSPDYKSRNVIFSFKMRKVLTNTIKDWWNGKSDHAVEKTA